MEVELADDGALRTAWVGKDHRRALPLQSLELGGSFKQSSLEISIESLSLSHWTRNRCPDLPDLAFGFQRRPITRVFDFRSNYLPTLQTVR